VPPGGSRYAGAGWRPASPDAFVIVLTCVVRYYDEAKRFARVETTKPAMAVSTTPKP
jgi:hypothetical protein